MGLEGFDGQVGSDLLDRELVLEARDDVSSLDFFDLGSRVLLDEVVNVHEATADTDLEVVALLNFDVDTLLTEAVHTLRLSEEQDLHFFSLRVHVDEVGKTLFDDVALFGDIVV